MFRARPNRILPLLFLIVALALSGCASFYQIVTTPKPAPTPIVSFLLGGVDNPDVYVDPAKFQSALLKALSERDTEKLLMWMAEPFLTGSWLADGSDSPPAYALNELYTNYLSPESKLAVVNDIDLKALMGGTDPLSFPRAEAGVKITWLVTGLGKDGRDEAVLFIARQPDNSLKWQGYMLVKGGFSGARFGGIKPYQNDALGFSLFVPKDAQVNQGAENYVAIVAPTGSGGHPGIAMLTVEPANGQTSDQIVQQVIESTKAQMGAGYEVPIPTAMGIDGSLGIAVSGLPGQDVTRQLFIVHNDLLYHIIFSPEDPQAGEPYQQMEDIYAMVVNTFNFTR